MGSNCGGPGIVKGGSVLEPGGAIGARGGSWNGDAGCGAVPGMGGIVRGGTSDGAACCESVAGAGGTPGIGPVPGSDGVGSGAAGVAGAPPGRPGKLGTGGGALPPGGLNRPLI